MNEEQLFHDCLQAKSRHERAALIERVCGSDAEMRRRVEALIQADQADDSLLDEALIISTGNVTRPDPTPMSQQIGPYKLLQRLGEGGFGIVYLAQQRQPVNRQVALKLIKPGMDSKQVIARFEAEQQALALMDHPNIAKVFDAGTTDTGQPYFVMEMVKGIPITKFCNQQKLPVRDRLELFIPVCNAIQHAHQKGLIHRDIKPSNVLVSLYDGNPVPKVIDFGVAKALQQRLTEKTMFTQIGQVVGTFEYMSPEQAEFNQLDIDTRSDVYSLGATLYELLTGSTPIRREDLRAQAFDEMLRMIREDEPPRPSHRLTSSREAAAISAQRSMETPRLVAAIEGELDWIVMKSIDKQRSRRYDTPNDLAKDITRFLSDEPVEASPPTASYRLRKFVRKNGRAIAVAATFALLLIGATVASSWLAFSASQETRRALAAESHSNRLSAELRKERDTARQQRANAVASAKEAQHFAAESAANAREANRHLYTAHMQQVRLEWEKGNLGRVRELLARYEDPKGDQPDPRGWEWRYWRHMCHRELHTLRAHDEAANDVAFNHDGSRLVSAGADGRLCLWNVPSGTLERTIEAHERACNCVAFSGTRLASGGRDQKVRLWDADSGQLLASFQYDCDITCIAFSPNGKLMAVGGRRRSGVPERGEFAVRRVIDVESGKELHRLDAQDDVRAVAFTKDNSQLAIAASPNLELWTVDTGELTNKVEIDQLRENNLQYRSTLAMAMGGADADPIVVTGGQDHHVHVRSLVDLSTVKTLKGHTSPVTSVVLWPDGKTVASAGVDNTIIVWNLDSGDEVRRLRGHEGVVSGLAISPDGIRLASSSVDRTVKIWDATHQTDFRPFLASNRGHYMRARFSPDSQLYAVSNFGGPPVGNTEYQQVDVRNALTGRLVLQTTGHRGWIDAIAFSLDGTKIATGSRDRSVRVYDMKSQEVLHRFDDFSWSISWLNFSPDGHWLRVSTPDVHPETRYGYMTQQIWDMRSGRREGKFKGTSMAFHPTGAFIAVASFDDDEKTAIDLYRLDEPLPEQKPFLSWPTTGNASSLRFDAAGRRLFANVGADVVIWNIDDGSAETTVAGAGRLHGLDETGDRFFTSTSTGGRKLNVWDSETGDAMCSIPLPNDVMDVTLDKTATRISARNLPYLHVLDIGQYDASEAVHLEARNLAAEMLNFPMMSEPFLTETCPQILQRVSKLRSVSDQVRRTASELIQEIYTPYEEGQQLASAATELVKPGRSDADYCRAFELAKLAHERSSEGTEVIYGFALYRVGRYREALVALETALSRSLAINSRDIAAVRAVIAMTHYRLENNDAAVEMIARAKTERDAMIPFIRELVSEADSLISANADGEQLMDRGSVLARSEEWSEAIAAFETAEQQLVGTLRARCLYYLAQTHLANGDREAHRQVCQRLISEFDLKAEPTVVQCIADASILSSDVFDNGQQQSQIIELCKSHELDEQLIGAMLFRGRQFDRALQLLPKARKRLSARILAIVAMAEWHAGNRDVARATLAECRTSLNDEASGARSLDDWCRGLEGRLLFEEASVLINTP